MASEINGVEIKKVWLDEHLWIGPTDRMIKFGGPFLPDDIHATFLFETRSGELDLHLTRNFPGGVQRHVAVLRAVPAEMRMITERWTARLAQRLLARLRRAMLGWLARDRPDAALWVFPAALGNCIRGRRDCHG